MTNKISEDIQHQHSDWQNRALIAVESTIVAKRQITYQALAEAAGIPPPHRINKLTQWLETLIAEDAQAGRPVRAACVISKVRGIPAPGFFACCNEHGLLAETADTESFYMRVLTALMAPD